METNGYDRVGMTDQLCQQQGIRPGWQAHGAGQDVAKHCIIVAKYWTSFQNQNVIGLENLRMTPHETSKGQEVTRRLQDNVWI